jgi:DNA repair exonuclease SbcCD ATPase subunit
MAAPISQAMVSYTKLKELSQELNELQEKTKKIQSQIEGLQKGAEASKEKKQLTAQASILEDRIKEINNLMLGIMSPKLEEHIVGTPDLFFLSERKATKAEKET